MNEIARHQGLPSLLAVREYQDRTGGDSMWPLYREGSTTPQLQPGERVLRELGAQVTQSVVVNGTWRQLWQLPAPFQVTLTDRRLCYICTRFTKGSTWIGFGGIGVLVAGAAMAASAAKAKGRRSGRAAVGQVQLDWLASAAFWPKNSAVSLTVTDGVSYQRIDLAPFDARINEALARSIVALAAHRRLARADTAQNRETLRALADKRGSYSPHPGLMVWDLPGCQPIGASPSETSLRPSSMSPLPSTSGTGEAAPSWQSSPTAATEDAPRAGWFTDPMQRDRTFRRRWWDGERWTGRLDPPAGAGDEVTDDVLLGLAAPTSAPSSVERAVFVAARPTSEPTAGWYRDPFLGGIGFRRRWWDGSEWSERTDPPWRSGDAAPSRAALLALGAPDGRR